MALRIEDYHLCGLLASSGLLYSSKFLLAPMYVRILFCPADLLSYKKLIDVLLTWFRAV